MAESILIVDDDPDIRMLLALLLEQRSFSVETAETGRAALERVKLDGPPRMILLDLMMPDMDGWTFRKKLLEDERTANVPVVIISAAHDVARHAADLGVADYLEKPFDSRRLFRVVETLCGSQRA